MPGQILFGILPCRGTSGSAAESATGAGQHREPPLTLSASLSQRILAPVQLFGQHPPGSEQLQGAVRLHLQVRDLASLMSPAVLPSIPQRVVGTSGHPGCGRSRAGGCPTLLPQVRHGLCAGKLLLRRWLRVLRDRYLQQGAFHREVLLAHHA